MVRPSSNGLNGAVKTAFPRTYRYPSAFERKCYKIKNRVVALLYPVRFLYFCCIFVVAFAFYYGRPANYLLTIFPAFDLSLFAILRITVAALVTAYVPVFAIRLFLKHFYFGYKRYLFESPKEPSIRTQLWRLCYKWLSGKNVPLGSTEALLPILPLPKLEDTVRRYLASVKVLLSEDEYSQLCTKANNFLHREGPRLQKNAWLYSWSVNNYVTNFWERYGYLSSRSGLLINTTIAHTNAHEDLVMTQAERAARLVYFEALLMLAIDRGTLPQPGCGLVCSSHYRKYHGTTRIPGEKIDRLISPYLSRHITAIYKGCFYKVFLFGEDDRLYGIDQLTEIFAELLSRTDTPVDGEEFLPSFTTDRRDSWHANRERYFLTNPVNRELLRTIEQGIAFMSLEDIDFHGYDAQHPENLDFYSKYSLCGNGRSVWADKSVSYTVSANGKYGGTNEHSIADGCDFDHLMESFLYMDFLYAKSNVDEQKEKGLLSTGRLRFAERLPVDVDHEMKTEALRCYSEFQVQIDDVDISSTFFSEFGKGVIKKGNVSPDGFLQMALQLAHYKDQGKFVHTYESASARFYQNSRTETLRSVTQESCDFVTAMLDESSNKDERLRLLRQAAETHVYNSKECMTGKGFDRHLFVLYVFSRGGRVDSPFLDYVMEQSWPLSTSQAPTMTSLSNEETNPGESWNGGHFGAVCKNGYGVCYRFAGNHSICFHVSSYHSAPNTDSHRFRDHIVESFREMAALFER